jgi:plasmid stabilization system protein ParE
MCEHITEYLPAQGPEQAQELGRQWQDALMDLSDAHFFFDQVGGAVGI